MKESKKDYKIYKDWESVYENVMSKYFVESIKERTYSHLWCFRKKFRHILKSNGQNFACDDRIMYKNSSRSDQTKA